MVISSAWAKGPALDPSWDEFRQACILNRAGAEMVFSGSGWKLNEVQYVPIGALERLQSSFSFDRAIKGLNDLPKVTLRFLKHGKFRFDSGRSLYADDRRITGVLYQGKVYIVDGHHRAMISTYAGSKTIPVQLIDDWSAKSAAQFFDDLKQQNLSYFVGFDGQWLGPGPFCDMFDDPMILLARKLLRRIDLSYDRDTGEFQILRERGAKVAIGIKINRDVPFTEQEIARVLRSRGVTWSSSDELTSTRLAEFLDILREERDGSRLDQLLLLDQPMTVAELRRKKNAILKSHFQRVQCEFQLSPGDQD